MRFAVTAFGLWLASLGCAPTVYPGLANAPGLGGSRVVDARVHDAISNGQDSCGRRPEPDPGPLRYRQPPCRGEVVPPTTSALVPSGLRDDAGAQRWMEHYYFGWPCRARQQELARGEVVAWSPVLSATGLCGWP